jgi:methylmalonyl-CoA mutase cobalamin-binding subunit
MRVTIDGIEYEQVTAAKPKGVALSILVPSVSTRRKTFAPLMADQLFGQHEKLSPADRLRVEILMLTDTGRSGGMLVGDKRNAMLRMARGDYVVFVDDDDRVEPDYIATLLDATEHGTDCITFDAMVRLDGGPAQPCQYRTSFARDENVPGFYRRLPNHLMVVRRLLALSAGFPAKQKGEDAEYAIRLKPLLASEHAIGRTLYHYDFSSVTTETQNAAPELPAVATTATTVDVIILSKASSGALKTMCQRAVDTCVQHAGGRVRVIVVEQAQGINYADAVTIFDPSEFNYNRFANKTAALGSAEWIMIANSDLEFAPGWLDPLLAAGSDCVSPLDPGRKPQQGIVTNAAGYSNGVHFSGWCFMVKRKLWERMGGFDECVNYWCSDDVVIEQCRALGVTPVLVPASRVKHLVSKTLSTPPDDMMWGNVVTFNKKYGQDRFNNDARFIAYKKRVGVL